jgi:membrane protease YdiL (CAAX protease family)
MNLIQRIAWFVLFLACGLLVFLVFSNYYPFYEGVKDVIGRMVAGGTFLALALLARRSERFRQYWLVPFAYFTALAAISVDYYLGLSKWILPALNISSESPAGWSIDKLESSLLSVAVILVINRLFANRLDSLYWQRGRLWLGLGVGLATFAAMLAIVIPFAELSFKGQNLSWARILGWMPWLFLFVLANALNEEVLFRGLFLGKLQPFVGAFAANLVMAIPFTLMHAGTDYATSTLIFVAVTLPFALAWGWLMQKTQSLWGSVLFHAAMDIPIVVGIFSNI